LLEPGDALLLLVARALQVPRQGAQLIAVLLRQAKDIAHLALERVEPLIQHCNRRLSRGGLVGESGGVGRAAAGEDLPLDLIELPLEPLNPLLGRWGRLPLGESLYREQGGGEGGAGGEITQ
jgi:hypothetical protein